MCLSEKVFRESQQRLSVAAGTAVDLVVLVRSLRSLLDGEMEHSAALRQETDLLRKKLAELEERHATKVQALAR